MFCKYCGKTIPDNGPEICNQCSMNNNADQATVRLYNDQADVTTADFNHTNAQPYTISQPMAPANATFVAPKKKSNTGLIIVIIVLIIAILGGIGFFIYSSQDNGTAIVVKDRDIPDMGLEHQEKFTFDDQSYIWFEDDLLLVDSSLFGKSYDEINKIFGNQLPATETIDWYYDESGHKHDWTEYKEAGSDLEKHGINFMFYNGKLEGISCDRIDEEWDYVELYDAANDVYDMTAYSNEKWTVNSNVIYTMTTYSSQQGEGEMVSQRYSIW